MKFSKLIRASEWWEYKLPPLLAIGYATILKFDGSIYTYWRWLLVILLSLIVGATYVSTINDITDLKDDIAAGKENRVQNSTSLVKWGIPVLCLLLGALFMFSVYYPDKWSMVFYAMPWLLFSLYSFPPFRLKTKGFWGVLCDAGGSHVFTTLLMISSVSFIMNKPVDPIWLTIAGAWAFCYGLRGILWHQFTDRENDLQSNTKTFATRTSPGKFIFFENVLFTIEVAATAGIFIYLNNPWILITYIFYIFLCLLRKRYLQKQPVLILGSKNHPIQILQLDYFQSIFPLTLLAFASFINKDDLLPLIFHLLLFPVTIIRIFKDIARIVRMLVSH